MSNTTKMSHSTKDVCLKDVCLKDVRLNCSSSHNLLYVFSLLIHKRSQVVTHENNGWALSCGFKAISAIPIPIPIPIPIGSHTRFNHVAEYEAGFNGVKKKAKDDLLS